MVSEDTSTEVWSRDPVSKSVIGIRNSIWLQLAVVGCLLISGGLVFQSGVAAGLIGIYGIFLTVIGLLAYAIIYLTKRVTY